MGTGRREAGHNDERSPPQFRFPMHRRVQLRIHMTRRIDDDKQVGIRTVADRRNVHDQIVFVLYKYNGRIKRDQARSRGTLCVVSWSWAHTSRPSPRQLCPALPPRSLCAVPVIPLACTLPCEHLVTPVLAMVSACSICPQRVNHRWCRCCWPPRRGRTGWPLPPAGSAAPGALRRP